MRIENIALVSRRPTRLESRKISYYGQQGMDIRSFFVVGHRTTKPLYFIKSIKSIGTQKQG